MIGKMGSRQINLSVHARRKAGRQALSPAVPGQHRQLWKNHNRLKKHSACHPRKAMPSSLLLRTTPV
eukprot:1156894-Pelagomonas_calceolata.AAC.15